MGGYTLNKERKGILILILCVQIMSLTACSKQKEESVYEFGVKSLDEVRLEGKRAEDFTKPIPEISGGYTT